MIRTAVAVGVLCALQSSPAAAQSKPSEAERVAAESRFRQAEEFYKRGLYKKAIESYTAAYELSGFDELLLNIAQSYRLDGNLESAVRIYQMFLERKPRHRYADEVRGLIAELTGQIELSKAPTEPVEQGATEPPPRQHPQPPVGGARQGPVVVEVQRRPASTGLRIAGISSGAAGLVAVGFGIKYGRDAARIEDELSAYNEQWTEAVLAKIDEGERADRNMTILVGLGAGAIVTGAVLYWLGREGPLQTELSVGPTSSGTGVAVGLGTSF